MNEVIKTILNLFIFFYENIFSKQANKKRKTGAINLTCFLGFGKKLFRQKAPSQITDWALNTPQEYQKLLYTNVQGKVNTYAKIKNMQKLVWSKNEQLF